MRGDQQGGTHPPGGGRGLLSGLGIASRHRMDGVLSKVLYPGAWFGSGPLGLVEPGIFLWRCGVAPGVGGSDRVPFGRGANGRVLVLREAQVAPTESLVVGTRSISRVVVASVLQTGYG